MIMTVLSGKGGVGKTSIATSLLYVLNKGVYVDMDAEEPNGHILLKPNFYKKEDFSLLIPEIQSDKCTYCGKCADSCPYAAIVIMKKLKKSLFFKNLCHSCGVCVHVCPEKGAIIEKEEKKGEIRFGKVENKYEFIDGILNIGEASSVQLISKINKIIKEKYNDFDVVIDAPPGTSCPVVESVKNSDFVIVVTEPTLFGLNDMNLVIDMLKKLNKKFAIVINKYEENNKIIEEYAEKENIKIIGKIPFSFDIAKKYSKGDLIINNGFKEEFRNIYEKVKELVNE